MSLRYAILVSLSHKEGSGYEIANYFDWSIGNFWKSSHQQIYKELATLAKDKLVTFKHINQKDKPSKKVYKITQAGEHELTKWLELPVDLAVRKDAFMIKVFAGGLGKPEVLLKELKRHQEIVKGLIDSFQEYEKSIFGDPEKLSVEKQFRYMTLQHGIISRKAWLKWSRQLEKIIKKQISD